MSGSEIAIEVGEGIREATADLGDGLPLVGYILRPGPADTTTTPPTRGAPVRSLVHPMFSTFSEKDMRLMNVSTADIKIMVAADTAEVIPVNSDKIEIQGNTYSLDMVEPYQPGGEVLYWTCKASRG